MKDLETRKDIHLVVHEFYNKLLVIPEMKVFFADDMEMDMESHLDIIVNFWDSALFGKGNYRGNVMHKHIELDKVRRLEIRHFDFWVNNWIVTLDENFSGPKTDEAKTKAINIKNLMLYKIESSRKPGFIQ
jgi:hemoglobin